MINWIHNTWSFPIDKRSSYRPLGLYESSEEILVSAHYFGDGTFGSPTYFCPDESFGSICLPTFLEQG